MKVVFKKDDEYIEVADTPCLPINDRVLRQEIIDEIELVHNGYLKQHLDFKSFKVVRISQTEQAVLVEEESDIKKFFNNNYYAKDLDKNVKASEESKIFNRLHKIVLKYEKNIVSSQKD